MSRQPRDSGAARGQDRTTVMEQFNGVKVFSATKARERDELGEVITHWLRENPGIEIVDRVVLQSSDNEFHCLTLTFFYRTVAKSTKAAD